MNEGAPPAKAPRCAGKGVWFPRASRLSSWLWVNPDHEKSLAQLGLVEIADFLGPGGCKMPRGTRTKVLRLGAPSGPAFFLKIYRGSLERYSFRWSRATREAVNLGILAGLGIQTPRVVSVGEQRAAGFLQGAFIVTGEVAGAQPFVDYLKSSGVSLKQEITDALIDGLVDIFVRMHSSGYYDRDAGLRNFLTANAGDFPFFFKIDSPSARRSSAFNFALAAHELAIPWRDFSKLGLVAFGDQLVRRYARRAGFGENEFYGAVLARASRMDLKYTRHRMQRGNKPAAEKNMRVNFRSDAPTLVFGDAGKSGEQGFAVEPVTLDHGRIQVSPPRLNAFKSAFPGGFDAVYGVSNPESIRKKKDREILTLTLSGPDGAKRLFMKKHYPASWLSAPPGRTEWENIFRLRRLGLSTPEPVATGFDAATRRSFLLTEEIEGGCPLDRFLREEAAKYFQGRELAAFYRRLARQLAVFIRKFHGAGYNHRDLYLCHFFIRLNQADWKTGKGSEVPFELVMLDLQRVELRRRFRRRWLVKDLAELLYSTRFVPASACDAMRFACAYWGVDRLDAKQKNFVRSVLRKVERIARHNRSR